MSKEYTFLWDHYGLLVSIALGQGNLSKAARILKEALREAEEFGEIPEQLILSAHSLADLYLTQSRFLEAEELYRAVLEIREKLLGQTHQDVIESLKKVTMVQIFAFRAEALGPNVVHSPYQWTSDPVAAAS